MGRWLRRAVCVACCVCAGMSTWAEVVTLRSGKTVRGEVLLRNEEVVIVRLPDGSRYQYPASEVVSVAEDKAQTESRQEAQKAVGGSKKAAVHVDVAGGAAYVPQIGWGGAVSAELLVGAHDLMGKQVFLGGGVGYHAVMAGGEVYSFVPLQVATFIPLTETQHAPVVNMALGYGFAVGNRAKGGIRAETGIGWRCRIHAKSSLSLSATVQWQQAQIHFTEVVDGNAYTRFAGTNMLSVGVKMGLHF